ncbi:hypothetical protein LNP74_27740 [Klebsiella pneumoniae subsp. pneumoniae]|nr:hypothetical protein [Klebsiella pneumoniae subsp. pneumoniae]
MKMSVKTVGKEKSRRAGYSRLLYVGLTDDVSAAAGSWKNRTSAASSLTCAATAAER